jgi:hypothetical protein
MKKMSVCLLIFLFAWVAMPFCACAQGVKDWKLLPGEGFGPVKLGKPLKIYAKPLGPLRLTSSSGDSNYLYSDTLSVTIVVGKHDGLIQCITTTSDKHMTKEGAYVGMPLTEFFKLYPDYRVPTGGRMISEEMGSDGASCHYNNRELGIWACVDGSGTKIVHIGIQPAQKKAP